ncbi:multiheme c-type cytochrome [Candidatus Leptofilum sp.]|uniref:multiheme c-type cytochrome n=1 Tax=Candidatus Leptofilum sp. TaxID=3241576 RepID=UPI003B596F16
MFKRVLIGVTFALILGFATFAATQAQTDPEAYGSDDCGECHEAVTAQWENSVHGHASIAESFLAAWAEADNEPECLACHTTGYSAATGSYDKEGIACETCHPSNPAEHPQKIMQTDISSRLCGSCHVDTFAEWETSEHGQEELTCARCHNPHSNALRVGSMQDTCRTCHKEETHFFTFTAHAEEGLLCTDCHLAAKSEPLGNGHSQISHTFSIGSETCTDCHNEEMHMPGSNLAQTMGNAVMMEASILPADTVESQDKISTAQPSPSSPYNFAILAALIGMAFGLVGSPWLEKWQAKLRAEKVGGHDGQ